MTGENKRAAVSSELKYRVEADYGRDFVLTDSALREDLTLCRLFNERFRSVIDEALKSG